MHSRIFFGDGFLGSSMVLFCGSGFFTLQLAQSGALSVLGVDNSIAQIELARKNSINPNTSYCVGDIFTQYSGIPVDIITAPFVVNYARTVPILKHFFSLIFKSLKEGGKAVLVIDLPNGKNLKRFGAIKTLNGKSVDETRISIDLFNDNERICTLTGIYYKPDTVERLLLDVGFHRVTWCTPVITKEGLNKYGSKFWEGYIQDPELGYVIAYK